MEKVVFLMGAPGSGKGTQGALISKKLSIPHISTGDIFRAMVKEDNSEAKVLTEYMQSGKLVPSEMVNDTIIRFLRSPENQAGVILDGYPRNLEQLEYFMKSISTKIITLFFDVDEDVLVKRITGRFSCLGCGKLYNKFFSPPNGDGCDDCGKSDFDFRSDDNEKIILKRLAEFRRETLPVIERLQSFDDFYKVDASQSIDMITREVCHLVKKV